MKDFWYLWYDNKMLTLAAFKKKFAQYLSMVK